MAKAVMGVMAIWIQEVNQAVSRVGDHSHIYGSGGYEANKAVTRLKVLEANKAVTRLRGKPPRPKTPMYTYKTTLRVIRRFGGEGRGWKGFSAPSQTESHEHLCPKLLSMVVVCFL